MALSSWVSVAKDSHFSIENIPFGIISTEDNPKPRPATAIGDYALDLEAFAAGNGFSGLSTIQPHQAVFSEPVLNAFGSLGKPIHSAVRRYLQSVLAKDGPFPDVLEKNEALQKKSLIRLDKVRNHLPFKIGDYTDFYVGLNHAENCSRIMRGIGSLNPNYRQLPVGYHGRASSVVVSGTPIQRPSGQILEKPGDQLPIFSHCRKLDFELELGCFICKPNEMGRPINIDEALDHLFGVVMMNDWSARDIQAWEMAPLGPFNAKNFGTTISPWVVTMEALEPFRTAGIENDQSILPYLRQNTDKTVYDIHLTVDLQTAKGGKLKVTETSSRNLLFSFEQMLAHHTVGGCPFNTGDLIGSGTISGKGDPSTFGALLEQTENGKVSLKLNNGEERTFLLDGDTVTFRGVCDNGSGNLVGFGECSGTIQPAFNFDQAYFSR
ncbi:fumarylacetoacetase [Verruconis gallopava]|uniref:Fumarylacetoacetase n=1 Tax=Verruconis gallopava TaxID=253628 RepID=A0A0D2AIM8_9PEZI|nr:fumarylacetoacetase [Verruconis gallopava]KIW06753.1 fumarylacetoacetase [Verruconis gallopava]